MSLRQRVVPSLLATALVSSAAERNHLPRFVAAPSALSWQAPQPQTASQRYKLTIVEDASTFGRAARGRASSEAVVKVTDENDRPVAGIVVTFSMPQLTGASFNGGTLTATSTTSTNGIASTRVSVNTNTSTDFSISVTASVPGTPLTASIPVSIAAATAVAGGGGLSGGTLAVILAAVGAGAAGGIYAATRGGNGPSPTPVSPNPGTPQPAPGIRIGIGGGISVVPGQ